MRVNNFNPYGCIYSEPSTKQNQQHNEAFAKQISKNVVRNGAVIAALLAAIDCDQEKNKKKQHRFRVLNKKKQARLLLASLNHIQFGILKYVQSEERVGQEKKKEFLICQTKNCNRNFTISNSAVKAITNAAEAWVIARNKELSETASLLFWAKEQENNNKF